MPVVARELGNNIPRIKILKPEKREVKKRGGKEETMMEMDRGIDGNDDYIKEECTSHATEVLIPKGEEQDSVLPISTHKNGIDRYDGIDECSPASDLTDSDGMYIDMHMFSFIDVYYIYDIHLYVHMCRLGG
jgi:hypothetical protein